MVLLILWFMNENNKNMPPYFTSVDDLIKTVENTKLLREMRKFNTRPLLKKRQWSLKALIILIEYKLLG